MRNSLRLCVLLMLTVAGFPNLSVASEKHGEYYGAKDTEFPSWFKESFLDLSEDVADAAESGKRLMLMFHQRGCPYCNALVERNLSQAHIAKKLREHFDVVTINLWGDRDVVTIGGRDYTEKDFAAALKVQFTPTLLFLDENGKTILRHNGYLPPHEFEASLDWAGEHQEKKLAFRDYLASLPKPPNLPSGLIGEKFFSRTSDLSRGNGRPLAVFFEQSDCPNCITLHRRVLIDKGLRGLIGEFDAVQLDMWSNKPIKDVAGKPTTARAWAQQLGVAYAPTIVMFDAAGDEIIRSEAAFRLFHTTGLFDYVHTQAYREQPNFQRWLAAKAEALQERGEDVDIWRYADQQPGEGKP